MAKNEKKEKRGGGAGLGVAIAAIILLLGGGAWGTGLLPGTGSGSGSDAGNTSVPSTTNAVVDDKNNDNEESKERTIIILLEQTNITVNGEKCNTVEDMNSKIKQLYNENNKTNFEFQEQYSIKANYDEVVSALKTVESILNIKIKGIE